MKLHYISHPRRNPNITTSIKQACLERSVEFNHINPATFDFTNESQTPSPGDLLYRASMSSAINSPPKTIERWLLHDKVATLYAAYERSMCQFPQSYVIHGKNNLPTPKTIWNVPRNRDLISKYADYVGGFPLIIKATGGSHGVGVMKIDSLPSLYSIIDYLHASNTEVIMREFIDTNCSARHIVLGNKIICSIEYCAPKNEFRSNVGKLTVKQKTFPEQINELAIKAVATMGYDFGGVDILVDNNNNPYIIEINFPCNFSRAAIATNTDIAGQVIDHLIKKSNKL